MARIPVTVLGGFLGSGKTTLLNWLLGADHGFKVAVIVNEFGDVGVDGQAVSGGEQFVELDNGCLCCALNADLEQLVRDLADRGGFDHMVIETTGLADPLPVGWTFTRLGLNDIYRLDAIVTVIDSKNFHRALEESTEARLQAERADIVVLNKLDLVEDDGAAAEKTLREINDVAPLLRSTQAEVPWGLILTTDEPSRIADTPFDPTYHHHTSYRAWSWQTEQTLDDRALEDLMYELPVSVYRLKGLVRTNAEWDWTMVNAVAGRFDLNPTEPRNPPETSTLVFIGQALPDDSELQQICDGLIAGSKT